MRSSLERLGRRALKSAVALLSYSLRTGWQRVPGASDGGGRVLILAYHRIVPDIFEAEREAISGLVTSVDTFHRHLELIREQYEVLGLDEAIGICRGERRVGRTAAVVTFDDGYRDVYDHAFPVLRSLGVPATVFIPTAYVGTARLLDHDRLYGLVRKARARGLDLHEPLVDAGLPPGIITWASSRRDPLRVVDRLVHLPVALRERAVATLEEALGVPPDGYPSGCRLLDWRMIEEMAGAGVSFGAHGHRHAVLTLEKPSTIEEEILRSKRALEARLDRPVRHFAYPNGRCDATVKRLLARAGFKAAVTTERRLNREGDDLLSLGRVCLCEESTRAVTGRYSNLLARWRLARHAPRDAPLSRGVLRVLASGSQASRLRAGPR